MEKGSMKLRVKLQQEQANLMKNAIKLVPCNTEDECTGQRTHSAQAEGVEVSLLLQKPHMELIQLTLSLKTGGKKKKTLISERTSGAEPIGTKSSRLSQGLDIGQMTKMFF